MLSFTYEKSLKINTYRTVFKLTCIELMTNNCKLTTAITAAAMHKLHSGGNSRAIRCKCVISAPLAVPPADIKCQFSALLP